GGGAGAVAMARSSRRFASVRALEERIRATLGPTNEGSLLTIVVVGAVAEEVFFRLAVQDAFRFLGSVAAHVALNTCTTGSSLREMPRRTWALLVLLQAVVLGSLMHFGFGLLGVTTANAVANHLCLRRILSP